MKTNSIKFPGFTHCVTLRSIPTKWTDYFKPRYSCFRIRPIGCCYEKNEAYGGLKSFGDACYQITTISSTAGQMGHPVSIRPNVFENQKITILVGYTDSYTVIREAELYSGPCGLFFWLWLTS
jgi:hypothetical protein